MGSIIPVKIRNSRIANTGLLTYCLRRTNKCLQPLKGARTQSVHPVSDLSAKSFLLLFTASALAGAGGYSLVDALKPVQAFVPASVATGCQTPSNRNPVTADSLDRILSSMRARVASDPCTPVEHPAPDSISIPIATVRLSSSSRFPWFIQQDPTGKRPIGIPGGELLVADAERKVVELATVKARYRIKGLGEEVCGGPELDASIDGWAYEVAPSALLTNYRRRAGEADQLLFSDAVVVALPADAKVQFQKESALPSKVRRVLTESKKDEGSLITYAGLTVDLDKNGVDEVLIHRGLSYFLGDRLVLVPGWDPSGC